MMRAREFPRLKTVSIERVCRSSRQRRAAGGLCSRIVVLGKLIALCGGYYIATYGGVFIAGPVTGELAVVGAGIVGAVVCVVAMLRVIKAAPWLPDDSLVFAWFICISGGACAVGFGVVVMMLIGAAP